MTFSQIKTWVGGLDDVLRGGFLEGSSVILLGPVITPKSHLAFQIVYEGLKNGEKCLLVSTNLSFNTLMGHLKISYNWDLKPYLDAGKLDFIYYPSLLTESGGRSGGLEGLREISFKTGEGVTRVVIHTFSQLYSTVGDESLVMNLIYRLKEKIEKNRGVVLYVLDSGVQSRQVEENLKSICDYVLEIKDDEGVIEMRVSKAPIPHRLDWHRLFFSPSGVRIGAPTTKTVKTGKKGSSLTSTLPSLETFLESP
jgi:KaiC/GvpD/RAD55 family RecA-like ATPase